MSIRFKRVRDIGMQIDEFCEDNDWKRVDLANKMGVTKSYISQICNRGGTPKIIEQIAEALGRSPWDFDAYHVLTFEQRIKEADPVATAALVKMLELHAKGENSWVRHDDGRRA